MRFALTAFVLLLMTGPGQGQSQSAELPDYLDDRSTAEQVIRSLYNAINRHEYLRAWTYYAENNRPDLTEFTSGYTDTAEVTLDLGPVTSDGAAGTIYWQVPLAITATGVDGATKTFAGCYTLYQPQPTLQEVPPFEPIAIKSGALKPVSDAQTQTAPESC